MIGIVAIAIGIFGYGEIISNLGQSAGDSKVFIAKMHDLFPTKQNFKDMTPAVLRGTVLGSILGVFPGGGPMLAAFSSYAFEKKVKMRPGEIPFGKGNICGVAAPESVNNSAAQTAFSRRPGRDTGRRAGKRDRDQDLLRKERRNTPPMVGELNPDLVAAAVGRILEIDPLSLPAAYEESLHKLAGILPQRDESPPV